MKVGEVPNGAIVMVNVDVNPAGSEPFDACTTKLNTPSEVGVPGKPAAVCIQGETIR